MEYSKKIPDSRILKFLTKSQLLNVWRDINFEIKNVKDNRNYKLENYYAYLNILYAYLIKAGVTPNKEFVETQCKGSFTYIVKLDKWVNTHKVHDRFIDLRCCNDGNHAMLRDYLKRNKDKKDAFTVPVEDILQYMKSPEKDYALRNVLNKLFFDNAYEPKEVLKNWKV